MAISSIVPNDWNYPIFVPVVDPSQAGNINQSQPAVIFAQKIAAGSAPNDIAVAVGSLSDAKVLFGEGSMAERMVNTWFLTNTTTELHVVPVSDPVAGVAATASITISSLPTQSDVLYYYIAGQLVSVNTFTTDTFATLALRLSTAINAMTTLPATAAIDGTTVGKINLTCRWVGQTGNDINIVANYLGRTGGQTTPAGYVATITPFSGGNGQPDLTAAIANVAATNYYHFASPFSDTGSYDALDQDVGFGLNGRWGYLREQYGKVYTAVRADYADALAFGAANNSAVISAMLIETTMPSPVWEVTAAYAATGAYYLNVDPAAPLQTLPLTGILPAFASNRFSKAELNILTNNGLAIQAVNASGAPAILREQMCYTRNSYGQSDTAFNLLTVLSTNEAILNRLGAAITSKFGRTKLAPNGTPLGAGQNAVTPNSIKAELISQYKQMVTDGIVVDIGDFTSNLIVEIDGNSPNKIKVLYPPALIGQLRQLQLVNQFRLQYQPT